MTLDDLIQEDADNSTSKGTYIAVRPDEQTVENIRKYIKDNQIPNPHDDFHCTVVYSRKELPDAEADGQLDDPIEASFKKFDVFKSQTQGNNVLVMIIDCPELHDRHQYFEEEHGATFDFPDYKPHVTLSYDIGEAIDVAKLPSPNFEIIFDEEYLEELDPN